MSAVATTSPRDAFGMRCVALGAWLMLCAVILGAVGSHLLQSQLTPQRFASYQTGVLYHLVHALGLIVVGLLAQLTPRSRWIVGAAWLFAIGIVCFSGSIYALTLGAPRALGMVAPFGGVSFMVGWICVALHASSRG